MSFWDLLAAWWKAQASKMPGDQVPHDSRGDETVDPASGIAEVDGQILNTTEIDPETQDKEKGFPGGTK